jgi:hypothetical protein
MVSGSCDCASCLDLNSIERAKKKTETVKTERAKKNCAIKQTIETEP